MSKAKEFLFVCKDLYAAQRLEQIHALIGVDHDNNTFKYVSFGSDLSGQLFDHIFIGLDSSNLKDDLQIKQFKDYIGLLSIKVKPNGTIQWLV